MQIKNALEILNKSIPLQLLIVSRGYLHFRNITKNYNFPCHFRRWNVEDFHNIIASADVCVIPNSQDKFSITKSSNRAVTALMLNVPVVADHIPSLEPLHNAIKINEWQENILYYLQDKQGAKQDIKIGTEFIHNNYSEPVISNKWLNLIERVILRRQLARTPNCD